MTTKAEAQPQAPRRFWKEVSVVAVPEGFAVALDGRPIKAPSKSLLAIPSRPLADAVAAEWDAMGEVINPAALPLTQLANTWLDRIQPLRAEIVAELLNYVEADLLCYRADHPADLVQRQAEEWEPLLQWAGERLGVRWTVATGVMPASQGPDVHAALAAAIGSHDDMALTSLQLAASVVGSLVVGLALVEGRITAEDAYRVAVLDEMYQAEQWGEDWEAIDRRKHIRTELLNAERFLTLGRNAGQAAL